MRVKTQGGTTYISYDINETFLNSMIDERAHEINISAIEEELRFGFEAEFYIDKELPNIAFERLIKYGMNAFAKNIAILPMSVSHNKNKDTWYVERDGTLEENDFGFEIVSPMLNARELPFYFEAVMGLIGEVGYTTESCGLHFHISSQKLETIDPTKLMLLLSESKAIEEWRDRSIHSKDILSVFENTKIDDFEKNLQKMSRFYNVNFIETNHLELRCYGGEDYQKHTKEIFNSLNSFVASYIYSCKPSEGLGLCRELRAKKESLSEGCLVVTFDEVSELALSLSNRLAEDEATLFEMAMSLLEEHRLVPRELLEREFFSQLNNKENTERLRLDQR